MANTLHATPDLLRKLMIEHTNPPGDEPGSDGPVAEPLTKRGPPSPAATDAGNAAPDPSSTAGHHPGAPARKANSAPGEPIRDPGDMPASRYALGPGFTLDAAVTTFQPVVLGKPKTFARADLSRAIPGVVVDATKAKQIGKDLWLVTPDAVQAGALEGVTEGYEAVLVPHVDRDGTPFLSVTRMRTRDGVELESYISATKLFRRKDQTWTKGTWVAGGYRSDDPPRPEMLGDPHWPEALPSIDDWVESAFKEKIIADPGHDVLRRLRGEI